MDGGIGPAGGDNLVVKGGWRYLATVVLECVYIDIHKVWRLTIG